jgi:hypothetical protein
MGWKKAVAHPTLRSYYYYLLIAPSSLSPTLSLSLSLSPTTSRGRQDSLLDKV